jgi:hypothetical protein
MVSSEGLEEGSDAELLEAEIRNRSSVCAGLGQPRNLDLIVQRLWRTQVDFRQGHAENEGRRWKELKDGRGLGMVPHACHPSSTGGVLK